MKRHAEYRELLRHFITNTVLFPFDIHYPQPLNVERGAPSMSNAKAPKGLSHSITLHASQFLEFFRSVYININLNFYIWTEAWGGLSL